MSKISIDDLDIKIKKSNEEDYISLTDIAKHKEKERPEIVIQNWLKNKHTIEFLGVWEKIHNPNFKHIEFDVFKSEAGKNSFILPSSRWIEKTNALGMIVNRGKYGGTYAHKYIALAFASWISPEFELYLVTEFDRLQKEKYKELDWNIKRSLSKINYKIHTDSIKENLIPKLIDTNKKYVYSSEAEILNLALYGITSKIWRENNKDKIGNIRDYSSVEQLVVLSNLESINALLIKEKLDEKNRLIKLNEVAISQMKSLVLNREVKKLK